jgi:hypothetical protein
MSHHTQLSKSYFEPQRPRDQDFKLEVVKISTSDQEMKVEILTVFQMFLIIFTIIRKAEFSNGAC